MIGLTCCFFFFQAEDGIRDGRVTGVQTCALPIWAARRAGLDRVRPHQLRYFAATAMQAAGAPLAEIGQVLRHEDERTTSLYAKVDVAALRPLAPPWPAAPSAARLRAGAP